MAETLLSPGVFLQENDLSQITAGPVAAGAALLGPTVIGPVNIPTLVTSYSQYKALFGAAFVSGGTNYEYLTSIAALNYFEQGGESLLVTRVASGSGGPTLSGYTSATASVVGINGTGSFTLETLSVGTIMNNVGGNNLGTRGSLPSGSSANIRWQITGCDTGSGVFSLVIRRGDDYNNSQTILETWNNLSLDPNQNNYIAYVIGDQVQTVRQDSTGDYYLQTSGSYQNKSLYVRVKSVEQPTPGYFNQVGVAQNIYTGSMPLIGSGSSSTVYTAANGAFGGAVGAPYGGFITANYTTNSPLNMFEGIKSSAATSATNNIQGLINSDYNIAINLLENTDAYDFNVIYAPGLNSQNAPSQVSSMLAVAQGRGDNIAVIDMVPYGAQINTVISEAISYDNSYGATYWPWVQVRSRETGKVNFVPPSTLVPAVYEYNDRVSAEWFAPAGLNRGSLSTVLQPERKIGVNDRNLLYQGKVNPIATFPGVGTVIYGQKTLQQKPSALDRVNVRRLLIALKSYIGQLGEQIVFEPNTQVTRNRFLSQVNPYLESVQQRQGLYAFQVVMDETNNTPDVVDRNQLVGTIYLQPTKTAEFIQLDFNILPTGATFGQ
jgi:phage tail sheath protein FI